MIDGRCVKIITTFVCQQGSFKEGNECVYRVPGPPVVYVDFHCPVGSYKDTVNKKCVFTAQVPTVAVKCPM